MAQLNIRIDSRETFSEACDWLHDAGCDEDEIKYVAARGTLDIIFSRDTGKGRRRFFIFRQAYYVRCHLHLENLGFFKMHSADPTLKVHIFNECQVQKDRYILRFCTPLKLEMSFVSSPSGFLKDMSDRKKHA